jgi:hypothetical protein
MTNKKLFLPLLFLSCCVAFFTVHAGEQRTEQEEQRFAALEKEYNETDWSIDSIMELLRETETFLQDYKKKEPFQSTVESLKDQIERDEFYYAYYQEVKKAKLEHEEYTNLKKKAAFVPPHISSSGDNTKDFPSSANNKNNSPTPGNNKERSIIDIVI